VVPLMELNSKGKLLTLPHCNKLECLSLSATSPSTFVGKAEVYMSGAPYET
jgi:hypothetical protein